MVNIKVTSCVYKWLFLPRSRDGIFDGALSDVTTPKSSGRRTEERIETDRTETERYTRKSRDRTARLYIIYSPIPLMSDIV